MSTTDTAPLVHSLGLPDLSNVDFDQLEVNHKIAYSKMIEEGIPKIMERVNALLAPYRAAKAILDADILAEIEANGGNLLQSDQFDATRVIPGEKKKSIVALLRLKEHLPYDVAAKVFTRKVALSGDIADETVAEIKAVCPGVDVKDVFDADGTQLNSLLKKHGENSEVGKIIADGYKWESTGPARLVITPRESAMKAVR